MELSSSHVQVSYPKKQPTRSWDPVHLEYPVRKFPETGDSSVTIGHRKLGLPEILKCPNAPLECMKEHFHDYNVEKNLMRSQSTVDFGFKHPETKRHNKHTSCTENVYIYPPNRKITDQPPQCNVHGTTEMKSAYSEPITPARLVNGKEQFMHPASQPSRPPDFEPSWHKNLEPLDTTHDGFEKYLDPYLTTSRLHHRPYTADQMSRESNSPAMNIVTYYTFSDTPMVRTPKTKSEFWRLPLPKPKYVYDREVFSKEFREIRTHNKPDWVPGSFRTEVRDNFTSYLAKPKYKIQNPEEEVQSFYQRRLANLPPNISEEYTNLLRGFTTSNSVVGSEKPLCAILDPYMKINKKLEIRDNKIVQKYRNRT